MLVYLDKIEEERQQQSPAIVIDLAKSLNNETRYVVSSAAGGFGNQLRGLFAGALVSLVTNRVLLQRIEWHRNYFDSLLPYDWRWSAHKADLRSASQKTINCDTLDRLKNAKERVIHFAPGSVSCYRKINTSVLTAPLEIHPFVWFNEFYALNDHSISLLTRGRNMCNNSLAIRFRVGIHMRRCVDCGWRNPRWMDNARLEAQIACMEKHVRNAQAARRFGRNETSIFFAADDVGIAPRVEERLEKFGRFCYQTNRRPGDFFNTAWNLIRAVDRARTDAVMLDWLMLGDADIGMSTGTTFADYAFARNNVPQFHLPYKDDMRCEPLYGQVI